MTTTRPYRGVSALDRRAERRQRLLDAGLELLGTRGAAGVSIAELCAAAGLTKRYFYEGFTSYDEFAAAVVAEAADLFAERVTKAVADLGASSTRATTAAMVRTLVDDRRLVRLLVVEPFGAGGSLVDQRRLLILRAVEDGLELAPPRSARAGSEDERRFRAHAVAGAVSEVLVAWFAGAFTLSEERLVDLVAELCDRMIDPKRPGR